MNVRRRLGARRWRGRRGRSAKRSLAVRELILHWDFKIWNQRPHTALINMDIFNKQLLLNEIYIESQK